MNTVKLSPQHKAFYQKTKKSLQNESNWVFGSKNRTTDFVVLDVKKDVELYKIVPPNDIHNVDTWVKKLQKIYVLSWYKADYILIYVDEDFNEVEREVFHLKK